MKLILVYIVSANKKEAKTIAKQLLLKKLIACANILPTESLYWWKGKIANEKEVVLVAKTVDVNFKNIKKEVEKIHSYDIPCIVKIPAEANKNYFDWVKKEIKH